MYVRWLRNSDDPELEEQVNRKIQALQIFEEEIPAVLIVHDLSDLSVVYMSRRGRDHLGVTLEEIRLSNEEYHNRYFNADDAKIYIPKIIGLVERNNSDELVSFFQQVRRSQEHEWEWYLSSTKIMIREKNGKPRIIVTMAVPVESKHPVATKVKKLLEENNFLQQYHNTFCTLTKREIEILKLMALGNSSQEIAQKLYISETTAKTHRRNIRNKLNAESPYDITRFAQAFDLI